MDSATVRFAATDQQIQLLSADIAERSGFSRGPIHRLELLDDGTAVQLRSVSGDVAAYRELLRESDVVSEAVVSGSQTGYAFVHFEPSPATRQLLEWRRQAEVIVEMPILVEDDDTVVITLVGEAGAFRPALAALPDHIDIEVVSTGSYGGSDSAFFESLTGTQRTVLAAAVEQGYYAHPRETTQADLAAELDLAPATVGEHLRKIEARLFSKFDPDRH